MKGIILEKKLFNKDFSLAFSLIICIIQERVFFSNVFFNVTGNVLMYSNSQTKLISNYLGHKANLGKYFCGGM